MTVKYFINGVEYDHLSDEQRRKITEQLAKAFGVVPANQRQQDEKREMIS